MNMWRSLKVNKKSLNSHISLEMLKRSKRRNPTLQASSMSSMWAEKAPSARCKSRSWSMRMKARQWVMMCKRRLASWSMPSTRRKMARSTAWSGTLSLAQSLRRWKVAKRPPPRSLYLIRRKLPRLHRWLQPKFHPWRPQRRFLQQRRFMSNSSSNQMLLLRNQMRCQRR